MHIEHLLAFISLIPIDDDEIIGWPEILNEIRFAHLKLMRLKAGLRVARSPESRGEGRTRPRLPYLMPMVELLRLWTVLTQKKVVTPRGTAIAKNAAVVEAIQPSTEFVRLALRMIDPSVTLPNVMTSIKNAMAFERQKVAFDREWSATSSVTRPWKRLSIFLRKIQQI
jgi:hypothetical protein